jgi:hypothetical protein
VIPRLVITAVALLGFPEAMAAVPTRVDHPKIVQPSCNAPAPLGASYQPEAAGYIVVVRGGPTEISDIATTLAKRYGFTIEELAHDLRMFYIPSISQDALAKLRCEAQIESLWYNAVITGG